MGYKYEIHHHHSDILISYILSWSGNIFVSLRSWDLQHLTLFSRCLVIPLYFATWRFSRPDVSRHAQERINNSPARGCRKGEAGRFVRGGSKRVAARHEGSWRRRAQRPLTPLGTMRGPRPSKGPGIPIGTHPAEILAHRLHCRWRNHRQAQRALTDRELIRCEERSSSNIRVFASRKKCTHGER